jgi:hypothetical protein
MASEEQGYTGFRSIVQEQPMGASLSFSQICQWQMPDLDAKDGHDGITARRVPPPRERRLHRRHDMELHGIAIDRWDAARGGRAPFGRIIDLSAGGIRIRTAQGNIHADQQIRIRIELPHFAGICPFVDMTGGEPRPKREWVGWMTVSRVTASAPRGSRSPAGSWTWRRSIGGCSDCTRSTGAGGVSRSVDARRARTNMRSWLTRHC